MNLSLTEVWAIGCGKKGWLLFPKLFNQNGIFSLSTRSWELGLFPPLMIELEPAAELGWQYLPSDDGLSSAIMLAERCVTREREWRRALALEYLSDYYRDLVERGFINEKIVSNEFA